MPDETAKALDATLAQEVPVAVPAGLADYDAIVLGTPTRFGNMRGEIRNFLDQTGGLSATCALVGNVDSVFASTGTQHGGQEITITSFHTMLVRHGMIVVGVPYTVAQPTDVKQITAAARPMAPAHSPTVTAHASRVKTN